LTVGVHQGQNADTQGLTRRAVKRGQAGIHSRATECWHLPPLRGCMTAVLKFRERTAADLMEFVVYISSTEGDNGHQGRQSIRLRRFWGCHQQNLLVFTVVGACQGQDADTQGLTRRAVKRGQAWMHSRATECWHVQPMKSILYLTCRMHYNESLGGLCDSSDWISSDFKRRQQQS